ncbi:10371_t:CDS:2 [Funneliformis mosseae]|uniref:10371_t:CDS:1 n=1 Tax=Funneliformis mosseae TaxID=27381 RepID=A0A9N8YMI3_FUNMO|nr:10371_t:CDS:2 [Funneliformis mosseae]
MTLFYTQPIRSFDHTCTENYNNIPPRSSSASPEKSSSKETIPRMCTTTPPSPSPSFNDKSCDLPIVAPCPKKALYAYAGHLLNNGFPSVLPTPQNPWGLSAVQEVIEDDPMFDPVELLETMSDEALACAELMEIMGNSSRGSSRPVSQSGSPDSGHLDRSLSPLNQDEEGETTKDVNNITYTPYTGAIEIEQIRQKPAPRPIRLAVDNSHLLFGSSPITRAHNPLPMDSCFSPSKRHHHQSQPYPSRPTLHQATNIQRKLCDAVADMHVSGDSLDDSSQPPLSKASKAAILLRISEGGRRRSLSVGSAGFKPSNKIIGRV